MSERRWIGFALAGASLLFVSMPNLPDASVEANELYINEIAWDCGGGGEGGPLNHRGGSDFRDEFFELRGTPGMSLANHYLIFVEAEDNAGHTGGAGLIENIFDLGAHSMGSNGFLTYRQANNLYDQFYGGVAAGTTDVVQAVVPQHGTNGQDTGWGNTTTSTVGHSAESGKRTIENSGWTAMLIRNNGDPIAAKPTVGLDLDVGNNGLDPIDPLNPHHWRANWTILDSIAVFTEGTEAFYGRTYAPLTFSTLAIGEDIDPDPEVEIIFSTPNIEPGTEYVAAPWAQVEREIEYIARWGNSTGHSSDDWHIVNVTQRSVAGSLQGAPDYRVSGDPHPGSPTDPPPPGQIVESNKNAPYRTVLFHTLGQPNYPLLVDGQVPGDYNEDGRVDAGDYVYWRNRLGAPLLKLANEGASLGTIDLDDYTFWKSHYGEPSSGGGGLVSVPEPTSITQSVAFLLAVAVCCRRQVRAR